MLPRKGWCAASWHSRFLASRMPLLSGRRSAFFSGLPWASWQLCIDKPNREESKHGVPEASAAFFRVRKMSTAVSHAPGGAPMRMKSDMFRRRVGHGRRP